MPVHFTVVTFGISLTACYEQNQFIGEFIK
jgi:hypothetical protein